MNTLNNFKSQFGEVLTREELRNLVGGVVAKCTALCPDSNDEIECDGISCTAIDGESCTSQTVDGPSVKLCPVVIN